MFDILTIRQGIFVSFELHFSEQIKFSDLYSIAGKLRERGNDLTLPSCG